MKYIYNHTISLGFFCSVASELDRIGLRYCSSPFDWVISDDIFKIIELINNQFEDFLNINYLEQYSNKRDFYKNNKWDIHFYHDFDGIRTCQQQLNDIMEKYTRRINRFYENIKDPTLFIRYIRSQEECNKIEKDINSILFELKKFNENNDIIFVANSDIESSNLKLFLVEKDDDDCVARLFLEKNNELKDYLNSNLSNKSD